jgi:Tfp pilus assembly protein PilF
MLAIILYFLALIINALIIKNLYYKIKIYFKFGDSTMKKVKVINKNIAIPTYEIAEYDKNPMFLEKRVYQGSSGKVYPYPVCEKVLNNKKDKNYNAIILENNYILVMILPELGGRIQRLYDKTNNYDAIYYNEVIKPALVGLTGPWISGGIEFNWPQHHRPSTFLPVDYTIKENSDGSVTVWVGEIEKMFYTKGMSGFTIYPDKAYLEIKGQLYNPTDKSQTFLWWANPAVSVNNFTKSIFPPDVNAVTDHGKRDISTFPIATGTYYKVDYSEGVDISMYKNIPVPTSYMAYHSDFDFIGNYDNSKEAGLLHIADHHISPGKKQWTWGNGDFGKAWDRNLTDKNGPYIELMTGVFTDNQPDFTFLKPYEEKTFVQYFLPYKKIGAVKNASLEVLLNVEIKKNKLICSAFSPINLDNLTVNIKYKNKIIFSDKINLSPIDIFIKEIEINIENEKDIEFSIDKIEKNILNYTPVEINTTSIPSPATALEIPEKIETTEKLFLAAVHLEQYHHATYSPKPYYLEGLKRDSTDIRLNNGYGKYLYNKGEYQKSEKYFKIAIESSTWKNPNPYDCEVYYNLGLSLKAQKKYSKAYDSFYKATWDSNMQDKSFYQLSCIATRNGNLENALEYIEKSLIKGLHNIKARNLKTTLLRLLNKNKEALEFANITKIIDPLDFGCLYEIYKLTKDTNELNNLKKIMRNDNHNYIELSINYNEAGLNNEAEKVLNLSNNLDEPMIHYYKYYYTNNLSELKKAESSNILYCFPNRLTDIDVLNNAIINGGIFAKYHLGNLFYDRNNWKESKKLWEECSENISIPTVYRNLALLYYNKLNSENNAKINMEKAFSMDKSDSRIFFELYQLYKILNYSTEYRLNNMNKYYNLLESRDDLYLEYITLLNISGEYKKAYNKILNHNFHPWEGGEGKITTQYKISLVNIAKSYIPTDVNKAIELLNEALVTPKNLGEGKLIGTLDNDIYYLLGTLYKNKEESKKAFEKASNCNSELSSPMYYNDEPPEMLYYSAMALKALDKSFESEKIFDILIKYGLEHMEDNIKIDYFAVSLPDFLIFHRDLKIKNRIHCYFMLSLGYLGKNNISKTKETVKKGLELENGHLGLIDIKNMIEKNCHL